MNKRPISFFTILVFAIAVHLTAYSHAKTYSTGNAAHSSSTSSEQNQSFDRSKLIPLKEALPQSARPEKPDYTPHSEREPYRNATTSYSVVRESSAGGKENAIILSPTDQVTSRGSTIPSIGMPLLGNYSSSRSSLGSMIVQHEDTATGQTVYVPLHQTGGYGYTGLHGSHYPSVYFPSKATYKVIRRQTGQ